MPRQLPWILTNYHTLRVTWFVTSRGLYLKEKSDAISQLKCIFVVIPYKFLDDFFLSCYFLDREILEFCHISGSLTSVSTDNNVRVGNYKRSEFKMLSSQSTYLGGWWRSSHVTEMLLWREVGKWPLSVCEQNPPFWSLPVEVCEGSNSGYSKHISWIEYLLMKESSPLWQCKITCENRLNGHLAWGQL